jgi:serralysin
LSNGGSPVVAGQHGQWTQIAAELTGTSTALKAMEVSFQQELNGDGSTGNGDVSTGAPPPSSSTVIEAFGSTSLVEDGSHYFNRMAGRRLY